MAFPNDFRRSILADDRFKNYDDSSKEELEVNQIPASVSGRIIAKRVMGKASFIKLQDVSGQIQVRMERIDYQKGFIKNLKNGMLAILLGFFLEFFFKTNTNELTVLADTSILLTKSLRPLPEKFHGLSNQEMRYRQRYVDLIMNEKSRKCIHYAVKDHHPDTRIHEYKIIS